MILRGRGRYINEGSIPRDAASMGRLKGGRGRTVNMGGGVKTEPSRDVWSIAVSKTGKGKGIYRDSRRLRQI